MLPSWPSKQLPLYLKWKNLFFVVKIVSFFFFMIHETMYKLKQCRYFTKDSNLTFWKDSYSTRMDLIKNQQNITWTSLGQISQRLTFDLQLVLYIVLVAVWPARFWNSDSIYPERQQGIKNPFMSEHCSLDGPRSRLGFPTDGQKQIWTEISYGKSAKQLIFRTYKWFWRSG